jgi:ATP-binding cassette, subfamily B, bacterial RamA/AmfB
VQAADRLVAQTVRYSGRWLVVLIATAVTGALMQLLLPFVLGRTVDSLIATAPASQAWLIGCAVVVVMLVVCNSFGVWAAGANSAEASTWLRHRILRHVLGVGPAMTRRFAEGDLVTRLGVNTEEAGRAPQALVTGVALLIPAVGSVIALVFIDFWLALTLVAGLMVIVVVLRVFLRETTVIAGGYQQAQSEIAARLLDALGGARTIGAAGTAGQETQRVLAPLPRVRASAVAGQRPGGGPGRCGGAAAGSGCARCRRVTAGGG